MRRVSYSPARQRETGRDREWESERDREIAYRAQVRNVNVRGTRTVRLGFWVYLQWHKQRLVHLSTTIVAWRSTIADRQRSSRHHTHTRTQQWGTGRWVECIFESRSHDWQHSLPYCLCPSPHLSLSLDRNDPQSVRQRRRNGNWNYQQANASAKARSVDPCSQNFSDRGVDCLKRRDRERVENWSCQWGGRGVQQQQQER